MKKVMLIGYGAMAQAVIERLPANVAIGWIVARESHHQAILDRFHGEVTPLVDPLACDAAPDLVLECASQQAVAQYGEAVLKRGWHLAVVSTGALADSELEQRLLNAGEINPAGRRGGGHRRFIGGKRGWLAARNLSVA